MANSWFRLHNEFADDLKVQMMSEADQRRLVMIFCIRSNGHVTLQDSEVTFQLRISNEEWSATKKLFIEKGFINEANEVLQWDKRQFISDSSASRVAKHRAKKKEAKKDVTMCNVTVTPPDTDTDTDTDNKKTCANAQQMQSKKEPIEFLKFWESYPKKKSKQEALRAWLKLKPDPELQTEILLAIENSKRDPQWLKNNGDYIPLPASWINGKRWEDELEMPIPVEVYQAPKRKYFN